MERRFKLGSSIVDPNRTPSLRFSEDAKNLIMTIPIISTDPKDEAGIEATHRDIFEISTGDAFGSNLNASLTSAGESETFLSVRMNVNSKVPGSGVETVDRDERANGKH